MTSCKQLVFTSVGRKALVGFTGLGLSGFVLMHMAGNMLLWAGPDAYNHYAHALTNNPLLPVAEVGLVVLFLVHIFFAIQLTLENRSARGIGPAKNASCVKAARFGSRYMILSGLLLLVFTVLHLITFKWGTYYPANMNGVEIRDLHRLVVEKFQSPLYVAWYLFSMVILGWHLSHGFAASFQSLGFASVRNPTLKKIGWAFAVIVAAGFFSQPIYGILRGQ